VTVSGKTRTGLAYELAGSGPPLLLLHTGLMDRRMWDPHFDALAERFTAIRFDARGFGQSADPDASWYPHEDALEVLDDLGFKRAALMGVSFGGSTALDAALAAPDRVTALVLVSSGPSDWEHAPEHMRLFEEIEAAYAERGAEAANELEMRMWVDGPHRRPDAVDRELRSQISAINRVLLERLEPLYEQGIEPQESARSATVHVGELRPPAMVVTGELDQPSNLAGCWAIVAATGAEHVDIPGTAHFPNLERPKEFLATVLPFLERHAPAPG
jgi:pimeloyl-ACP methyl ester carboxylesterase